MKISELKSLIEKRRELLKKLPNVEDKEEQERVIKQCNELQEKFSENNNIFIASNYATIKLRKDLLPFFEQRYIVVHKFVKDYCCYLEINSKRYNIGRIDSFNNIRIDCLLFDEYFKGWDELFEDYPELKEYLWNVLKQKIVEKKDATIKRQTSLIEKKILKNSGELFFLKHPDLIEKKKKELISEQANLKRERQKLEDSLEEID